MTEQERAAALTQAELSTLGKNMWWFSVAIWIFEWFLWAVVAKDEQIFNSFGWRTIWMLSGLLVGYIAWRITSPFHYLPFWKLVAIVIGAFFILGPVHTISNFLLVAYFENDWGDPGRLPLTLYISSRFWLHFFLAWGCGMLAYVYAFKVQREELGRVQAQAMAQRAQVQAFRYQIHPHFLFNTFNSIAALILDGSKHEAESMIRRLSAYLRRALSQDATHDTTIKREFAQQIEYLELERVRFPDRLMISTRVGEGGEDASRVANAMIPGFLLQPLVENAVRHGVQHSRSETEILLSAHEERGRLIVQVCNTGDSRAAKQEEIEAQWGKGLEHVRSQLTARFGTDFTMEVDDSEEQKFTVEINMPFVEGRS